MSLKNRLDKLEDRVFGNSQGPIVFRTIYERKDGQPPRLSDTRLRISQGDYHGCFNPGDYPTEAAYMDAVDAVFFELTGKPYDWRADEISRTRTNYDKTSEKGAQ